MPFVERDQQGSVTALYARPQPGRAETKLSDDHPDVVAFRNPPPPTKRDLVRQRLQEDPDFRALVAVVRDIKGVTDRQIVDDLEQKRDAEIRDNGPAQPRP